MKSVISNFKQLFLASALTLVTQLTFAQWPDNYGTGTITATYCVSIDTAQPLQEYYKIDISQLNFATEIDAQKVFGAISNNRLTYKVDFAGQAAYLKVHADRTQYPQDVIWWNNYIQSLCQN